MITRNVGNADRVIRVIAGLALAFAACKSAGPAALIMGAAAAMAIMTGLIGWCGIYKVLGINTCKIDAP